MTATQTESFHVFICGFAQNAPQKTRMRFWREAARAASARRGRQEPRFVVLEDNTLFAYKCDNLYCKESERGLMFNDPALKIEWPKMDMPILLSEKDRKHPPLAEIEQWE